MGDQLDAFVAGIGTGGTITGAGEVLKEKYPDIKIVAVEPNDSPILSGGKPGPHKIQGIGANFVPKVLDTEIYDEIITLLLKKHLNAARKVASERRNFRWNFFRCCDSCCLRNCEKIRKR